MSNIDNNGAWYSTLATSQKIVFGCLLAAVGFILFGQIIGALQVQDFSWNLLYDDTKSGYKAKVWITGVIAIGIVLYAIYHVFIYKPKN